MGLMFFDLLPSPFPGKHVLCPLRLPTVPVARQPYFAMQLLHTCRATPNP